MDIRHAVGVKENIGEETLAALRDWRTSDHLSGREKAALELTEEIVADDREVSDACFARVREHFSEADVLELVFVIGYQVFASKFAKAFRLAPQGFAARA
jgi:alkylhydroperoxidase family enzyme